jgi:pyridinium-3,5-biscarboxylic acid mononucleotide sulfurtransferase
VTENLTLQKKLIHLNEILDSLQSVAIAFSGGADSALLAAAAFRRLKHKAVAITAFSPTLAMEEQDDAVKIAAEIGIRHVMLPADELESEGFRQNGPDRCFHCKKLRFGVLADWAAQNDIPWIIEGSNADDVGDYRPGMKAIASMPNVRSPLLEAGLTKAEIRTLSKEWALPTWNKPSAACLASRVAYGQTISTANLSQIEQAERIVRRFVAGQVRVRHHGIVARIEIEPAEMPKLISPDNAKSITAELKALGFSFITLDLSGYRMGSLNETL